ncbi:hypothetical protein AVEN_179650-1 [Araneus ventricosus]|uniref:Uncharacterized protein n=1 Tax=Araneus ventricosus TaxID=182803 RepID=A0A4Y2EUH7_ARAVE|nr:hypothetical protein AVEN_232271-1 [Araneus ventricosus]GBM32884.1 hypothetical protein AVEN_265099-1 [Araneus ventricosus]GBM32907.1 hypothetical protein AVEN_116951-1 [Araneus ventricosus]GBM32930.1 hypothetical protein AVEN_179650-1 [Araneus ventricosus]
MDAPSGNEAALTARVSIDIPIDFCAQRTTRKEIHSLSLREGNTLSPDIEIVFGHWRKSRVCVTAIKESEGDTLSPEIEIVFLRVCVTAIKEVLHMPVWDGSESLTCH